MSRSRPALVPLLSIALLAVSCAHAPPSFADFGAREPVALAAGEEGPEVEALVAQFYGQAFAPQAMRDAIDATLARYPHSSRAHEVAAYFAMLNVDVVEATRHFVAAASDLRSPFTELYLYELALEVHTASEQSSILALLETLSREHPSAAVRGLARAYAIGFLRARLQLDAARATARELGFVQAWQVAGAFDNDEGKGFFTSYPPERGINLQEEMAGKLLPVHWRRLAARDDGALPLDDYVSPNDSSLAYLLLFVQSPSAREAVLRLTVGDAVQVWWNDAPVASEEKVSDAGPDNVRVPITMAAGWNKLLVKASTKHDTWEVRARLTDAAGEPWRDLAYNTDPQPYTAAKAASSAAPKLAFLPQALGELTSANRRAVLTSRLALAAGRYKEVLSPLEGMLQSTPDNALGRYLTALAYWDNDELGKAIDVLNGGVSRYPELAAFAVKRGRYYRQKKLWDKALADLRQADLGTTLSPPRARRALRFELAELFKARGFAIDSCSELERLLADWPDLAPAWADYGECLDGRGYSARAEEALRAARALEPGGTRYVQWLAGLEQRRFAWQPALALTRKLRQLDATAKNTFIQEATLLRRAGEREQARARLQAAASQAPEWATPYERLADLAYEDGQPDQAMALYEKALARNPQNASLASFVEYLKPKGLGFLEQFVPKQEQLDAVVAAAARCEVFAGSQAVLLLDHEVTEIGNDGSAKRIVTEVTRAESIQAVDGLTKVDLPRSGTLRVLQAYALSPRGERQEASSIQGSTLRFRKLEPGSITVLQYTHYQPPGAFLPNHFAETWMLQGVRAQHENSTWVLVYPKTRHLTVETKGEVKSSIHEDGDMVVRTFSAEHVPPLIDEAFMPPAHDLLWQVQLSTLATWDEYVRWERALLSDAFRSSPELEALAGRLTKDASSVPEKLDKLYHFVAHDIRYQQEYETTIAGVRPHPGPVVLERGYGDCKDKAVLLIRLAKLVGLRLEFALLRTTDYGEVHRNIPNQQFNHAIVFVPAQEGFAEPFFMDPTTDGLDMGNLRADDQGALALVLEPEGEGFRFLDIPYQDAKLDYERHRISLQITSPTSATATDDVTLRGRSAAHLRHLLRNREVADKALQQFGSTLFAGATLTGTSAQDADNIWKPLELSLSLDVASALQAQGDRWRVAVPAIVPATKAGTLASRRTPVRLGPPSILDYDVDAELPDGFEVTQAPAALAIDQGCFHALRTTRVDGRKVSVHFEFTHSCPEIAVANYPEFRLALQKVVNQLQDEIVFGRVAGHRR
jgi:cellulose synthase operon protein C